MSFITAYFSSKAGKQAAALRLVSVQRQDIQIIRIFTDVFLTLALSNELLSYHF